MTYLLAQLETGALNRAGHSLDRVTCFISWSNNGLMGAYLFDKGIWNLLHKAGSPVVMVTTIKPPRFRIG